MRLESLSNFPRMRCDSTVVSIVVSFEQISEKAFYFVLTGQEFLRKMLLINGKIKLEITNAKSFKVIEGNSL